MLVCLRLGLERFLFQKNATHKCRLHAAARNEYQVVIATKSCLIMPGDICKTVMLRKIDMFTFYPFLI